jgi:hypothetical protein
LEIYELEKPLEKHRAIEIDSLSPIIHEKAPVTRRFFARDTHFPNYQTCVNVHTDFQRGDMKYALVLSAGLLLSSCARFHKGEAGPEGRVRERGVVGSMPYVLVGESTSPVSAHRSGNVFAERVGNLLKTRYPSRVQSPNVKMEVVHRGKQKLYRLTWSCLVVDASERNADYYFDRRGSLQSGKTLAEARIKVEREMQASRKRQSALTIAERAVLQPSFVRSASAG